MKILNAKSIIASCLTAAVMSAAISVPVLADSVDITEIDMDVTLSVELNSGNPYEVFELTPSETGPCYIYSAGASVEAVAQLYDSEDALYSDISGQNNNGCIDYCDAGGHGSDFWLKHDLKAGTTYYILIIEEGWADSSCSFNVSVYSGLSVGDEYALGSSIRFSSLDYFVYDDDSDYRTSHFADGEALTVSSLKYDAYFGQYEVILFNEWVGFYTMWVSSDDIGTNVVLTVDGGDGSQGNPFDFGIGPGANPGPAPSDVSYTPEQLRLMSIRNFVEKLYLSALGRPHDVAGRDYWVDQLLNGVTGSSVVLGFINSPEFVGKNTSDREFVITLYNVFFSRVPSESEIASWTNYIASNSAGRTEVIKYFANCPEWINYCDFYYVNP